MFIKFYRLKFFFENFCIIRSCTKFKCPAAASRRRRSCKFKAQPPTVIFKWTDRTSDILLFGIKKKNGFVERRSGGKP